METRNKVIYPVAVEHHGTWAECVKRMPIWPSSLVTVNSGNKTVTIWYRNVCRDDLVYTKEGWAYRKPVDKKMDGRTPLHRTFAIRETALFSKLTDVEIYSVKEMLRWRPYLNWERSRPTNTYDPDRPDFVLTWIGVDRQYTPWAQWVTVDRKNKLIILWNRKCMMKFNGKQWYHDLATPNERGIYPKFTKKSPMLYCIKIKDKNFPKNKYIESGLYEVKELVEMDNYSRFYDA